MKIIDHKKLMINNKTSILYAIEKGHDKMMMLQVKNKEVSHDTSIKY